MRTIINALSSETKFLILCNGNRLFHNSPYKVHIYNKIMNSKRMGASDAVMLETFKVHRINCCI